MHVGGAGERHPCCLPLDAVLTRGGIECRLHYWRRCSHEENGDVVVSVPLEAVPMRWLTLLMEAMFGG